MLRKAVAGVEGLPVLRAFNGLRESGAIAHPHIILGNPGDCPTAKDGTGRFPGLVAGFANRAGYDFAVRRCPEWSLQELGLFTFSVGSNRSCNLISKQR